METIQQIIGSISSFVWGVPMLLLLLGTGLFLTVFLRGIQFRELLHALWLALVVRKEEGAEGDISHFQALMTAMAAQVGVGNIAGVATAIASGGPGALFWMWMTGLVGMATKYCEAILGVRFREVDSRGQMSGGPMYYLKNGVGGGLGKTLGFLFALFAAFAAFGIGDMVQSNSVADALQSTFGVPPIATGVAIAVLAGMVILGGIKSIGRVTGIFVPIMVVFYLVGGLVVLLINWRGVPDIVRLVFAEAFSPAAAAGGFLGATVREAMRWGIARGVFSNESGLGTGGIAAAAAQTREPARQALIAMTQVFIDTLVVCSITGFTIIGTGAWTRIDPITEVGYTGAPLTAEAFQTGLPGEWGGIVVALALAFFAFSTILGWAYYGEKATEYILGERAILPYRLVFIGLAFYGASVLQFAEQQSQGFQFVWDFSDMMNGAMAIPNLVGLLLLAPFVVRETRDYFTRHPRWGVPSGGDEPARESDQR
jgi:AGCS family alanine or glycine:cation symporter